MQVHCPCTWVSMVVSDADVGWWVTPVVFPAQHRALTFNAVSWAPASTSPWKWVFAAGFRYAVPSGCPRAGGRVLQPPALGTGEPSAAKEV